ncbi:MAG TPA: hypothetical protein VGH28_06495 [Polyangiaceae bacterium]|jgi:hypothetical protein
MRSVAKYVVSAVVVGISALACNNTPAPEQAIVASNVQPGAGGGGTCNSPEQFIYLPQTAPVPGPDTNDDKNITPNLTGDVAITCKVQPNGNGYDVVLQAQITGGTSPGTMTVSGTFTPRVRDPNGNATATGDATVIPNIKVDMLDATKHLEQTDCTAQYVLADNGGPGASLPNNADVFADDHGGRIWASVFCPKPTNLDESQKPGNAGCEMSATFRFENCTNK